MSPRTVLARDLARPRAGHRPLPSSLPAVRAGVLPVHAVPPSSWAPSSPSSSQACLSEGTDDMTVIQDRPQETGNAVLLGWPVLTLLVLCSPSQTEQS